MKWTPLHVVVFAATIYLSAFSPVRVCADPPTNKKQAPAETKPQDAKKTSPPGSQKESGETLTVEESAAKKQEDKDKAPDRHLTRGDRLARSAMSYRGAPYRFGGRSASTGFDCSGLVQAVCAKWGIYLPRAANAQYNTGKPVSKDQLQPGDLVFFANTYKSGISHVGIYIGEGEFIHAAGSGKGVVVSKLEDDYHKKHYAGARRLDLSKLPPVPGEEDVPKRIILDDGNGEDRGKSPPNK